MESVSSIVIAVVSVVVCIFVLYFISNIQKKKKNAPLSKKRATIIRDATKKLSQNPHNAGALNELSDLYYREHLWDKAFPLFDLMLGLATSNKDIDPYQTALRQGVCGLKLGKYEDALKGLVSAIKINRESFESNYYLAQAYYYLKEYEKAVPYLKRALAVNHEATDIYEWLGLSLYNLKHFRDALPYLKRALTDKPELKAVLYAMADSMQQTGFGEKALKVFMHLRPDPEFGARSCLAAGTMHMNSGALEKAEQDFEIGLKHSNIPPEVLLEIKYRLAGCYLQTKKMDKGLLLLCEIQAVNPSYRDVSSLVTRYQELKQNANLQIYLTAGNSDFVALCRKVVMGFYEKASVKILDIAVTADNTEVLTEIETAKWEDTIIFRFYRTTGSIGELYIRDFHGRIRDIKAGRGICFTAGTFSDEARNYIEGRPVDLIEKAMLIKLLKRIDTV
ncbi:MAG: tetratricopeptide repeat protein [Spirochaetaceae bacterium]|nr:tetratricopeptide repeat protein [Spirochaetaceae bacterium]